MTQRQADFSAKVGREVQQLRQLALRMAGLAEAILDKSIRSAWSRDPELAGDVSADDLEIDRLEIEIDQTVLNVLALQAPVASDLRQVLAIKTMANEETQWVL
jgi:phosphate transport system protein